MNIYHVSRDPSGQAGGWPGSSAPFGGNIIFNEVAL